MFWDEKAIDKLTMINRDLYEKEWTLFGKADIARLEILYQYGGMYVDADSVWINNKDFGELFKEGEEAGFMLAKEPDPQPYLANGVMAATPGHKTTEFLIGKLRERHPHMRELYCPAIVSGPHLVSLIRGVPGLKYKELPSYIFYPIHWVGITDVEYHLKNKIDERSFMFQYGYSSNDMHKVLD